MAFDALYIILPVAAAIFGAGGGVFVKNIYDKNSAESKVAKADEMVKKMITDAQKRAETLKKETILEAKEEVYRLKTENERESKERRSELQRAERRLQQKEESFDKKQDALEQREQQLAKRIKAIDAKEASVSKLYDAQQQELERVAGMTQDEAKDVLLNNVEKEARHEAALIIRDIESKAKAEADQARREHHFNGDSALRSGSCCGIHRFRCGSAQRRNERPHHRQGRTQHPHTRNRNRR